MADRFRLLPNELKYSIAESLTDDDRIELFRVYPDLYLPLKEGYTLTELKNLNDQLNEELEMNTEITDKFEITRLLMLQPGLPPNFTSRRLIQDWSLYWQLLLEELIKFINIFSQVTAIEVDGWVYPIPGQAEVMEIPTTITYRYRLNQRPEAITSFFNAQVRSNPLGADDLRPALKQVLETGIIGYPASLEVKNVGSLRYRPLRSDNATFEILIAQELEEDDDTNSLFFEEYPLPRPEVVILPPHFTLEELIQAYYQVKPAKLDSKHEKLLSVEKTGQTLELIFGFTKNE